MRGRKWMENEVRLATDLRLSGSSYEEIAQQLGRSWRSVKEFLNNKHIVLPREVRQKRMLKAALARESKKKFRGVSHPTSSVIGTVIKVNVPAHVAADRERRANEYRSPAQIMLGDPPFSQSALARHPGNGAD